MAAFGTRKQVMFWIAAALIATATLAGVLLVEHRSAARRVMFVVGVPEKGAALFFGSKQCSTCHSINGSGGRVAPDLSGRKPGTPAMGWLTTVLWNHAPGMWRQMRRGSGAYPKLSQEEMAHMLAFLYQAGNTDRPGDTTAGERIFHEKSCVRCHNVRGSGANAAPDLSRAGGAGDASAWTRAMWNHAQSMIEPVTRAVGRWPQFNGGEMNDLIAYVSSGTAQSRRGAAQGSAEAGWRVFQAKCMQCHAVRGQGGTVGPELGPERDLPLSTAQFASVMWNHAPSMLRQVRQAGVPSPTLQGNEMLDLLAFLRSLRYFEPAGNALLGERLFSERGCGRCHGGKAEGTQLAPALRAGPDAFTAVSFTTALWRHGPQMQDRAEEMGIDWPVLKASDVGDLVSFLNEPSRR